MTTKVLLVDDNQTFIASLRLFLGMLPDMEVVGEASNGLEAVNQASRLQPDLALLDIALPQMNGLEVARRLQSLPRPPSIIFVSIHDEAHYREAAADLGVAGYVSKADFVTELFPIVTRMAGDRPAGLRLN
ncbi:MAG: response regulator transcription factor [Hylemonella sp.]|uniref:response regulator n=1 Tax=Hylemonella sp. TaxID=2066020 RepID=UPI0039198CDE